jgi:hypothetical protein
MRFLSFLTTVLITVLLVSCGGGGGSPGISSGSIQSFAVAAPSLLTLQVGLTQQYIIQGGVKPYTVFSTNPAVTVAWLVGENVVAVGATAAGTATVTVQDAKGGKFDMVVTAGSSTAFFTTAPAALTIAPGALAAQTFKMGGGTPPYKAVSNFPSALSVVVNGTDVTYTALQIPGTATVTLSDSSSPPAAFTSVVTLGTIPLAINPAKLKAPIGTTIRSVITGGTPPYRAVVLDNCTTSVQIVQGNILQATTALACTGAAITVVDANNQTVSMDFEVSAGILGIQLAPSALTVTENTNTPSLSLLVYGANGPLQVFTTNAGVLAPQTPVSNADGTFTIPLAGGNTCYNGAGVDNTVPPDGDFTDTALVPGTQPTADVAPKPTATITITVLDSTGRQGTSTITIKDNGLGGAGCN